MWRRATPRLALASISTAARSRKSSPAMATGLAIAEGRGVTLDAPVSTWLAEWLDEPRGRITLRQLLEETSGLETGGDIQGLLRRAPFSDLATLPRFATAGEPLRYRVTVRNDGSRSQRGLVLLEDTEDPRPSLAEFLAAREPGEERRNWFDRTVGYPRWMWLIERRRGARVPAVPGQLLVGQRQRPERAVAHLGPHAAQPRACIRVDSLEVVALGATGDEQAHARRTVPPRHQLAGEALDEHPP